MPSQPVFAPIPPHILQHFDISPFLDMLLKMSQERTIEGLLDLSTRVYRGTHVALGALWMLDDHQNAPDSPLRLRVVAGAFKRHPRSWTHAEGTYERLPQTEPLVGIVATERSPLSAASPLEWERPDWAIHEGYAAYSAFPMLFKGQLIGVLGIFYDRPMTNDLQGLHTLHQKMHTIYADSFAAAVVNARAFEEINRLRQELEVENQCLRLQVERGEAALTPSIVGDSDALRRVLTQVDMVAPTDATVLLLGESGTGKELIAEAIHRRSPRVTKPLIRVNCSAIPRELFESEFFGHMKGAFTGALRDRIGRFQSAEGGTLFLDEVGEIPLELQGKLLRVLQEGTFERVGEDRSRTVDVRIIAATNKNLLQEVEAGRFRQDLFFRLSVFPIELPALRERPEDIPLLARYFIDKASRRHSLPAPRLTPAVLARLQAHAWPGNVREMENVIERAVIMAEDGALSMAALPSASLTPPNAAEVSMPLYESIITEEQWRSMQHRNILQALETSQWRIHGVGGAAELLGIPPTTLRSRMSALGIQKK